MNRRNATGGLLACTCLPLLPVQALADGTPALIDAAFEYAFPLFEMARTRWGAVDNPANPARTPANQVQHRRQLADHRSRAVTTPNNDTLYSSAWLDLSQGPVRISAGPVPQGRYWSIALMDGWTNNFQMLGSRLDGSGPVQATLLPFNHQGAEPAGRVIRAPGQDVWLLGRWLVDGPDDLARVAALQNTLRIEAPATDATQRRPPGPVGTPAQFLAVVNAALRRNPPLAGEQTLAASFAAVGLGAESPSFETLAPEIQATWAARIGPAVARLRAGFTHSATQRQGWHTPAAGIGNFGRNYALRAAVALGGLAALEPAEALYLSREADDAGQALDGQQRYRLTIPASGVPTRAFWSLSMYEQMPDGRRFFTDNPIARYAIGDRTPGLQRNADGSMDLWLQREAPADAAQRANWLPTPAAGPLQLTLRAYVPAPELLAGRAALPSVSRL